MVHNCAITIIIMVYNCGITIIMVHNCAITIIIMVYNVMYDPSLFSFCLACDTCRHFTQMYHALRDRPLCMPGQDVDL